MKTKHSISLLCALTVVTLVISPGFYCSRAKLITSAGITTQIEQDVRVLSADSLEGRGTGTPGETKAALYISRRFQQLGLIPKGNGGSWFQEFSFKPHPPVHLHQEGDSIKMGMAPAIEITGRNVLGFIDFNAAQTIIIGAHFDHLGYGDENSLFHGGKAIHNGADDNASGVACLLELAKRISEKRIDYDRNNYLFIAFSGEEKGLWGSNYFCKNPTVPLSGINYMLNMDMVGRLNTEKSLAVNGVGTSPVWMEVLPGIHRDEITIVTTESGIGPSDHSSFYNSGIPALHFFTGQHGDYHKPSDDADKINYSGILSVTGFIDDLIRQLNSKGKLLFTKTKDEATPSVGDFKVTLGIMPDYLFSGSGLRIDGVRETRPAANAGMKQGDIIIKIGDYSVTDMSSYMSCLGKFEKGQKTMVVILREGKETPLEIIW
ncbi:MAG: M28 family peptidase [Crocinitomicaceae bacterium]|nr:M28 family peptidase [Crocinitomicaceae bacterium]